MASPSPRDPGRYHPIRVRAMVPGTPPTSVPTTGILLHDIDFEDRVREPLGDAAQESTADPEEGGDGMADPALERDHAAQIERVARART